MQILRTTLSSGNWMCNWCSDVETPQKMWIPLRVDLEMFDLMFHGHRHGAGCHWCLTDVWLHQVTADGFHLTLCRHGMVYPMTANSDETQGGQKYYCKKKQLFNARLNHQVYLTKRHTFHLHPLRTASKWTRRAPRPRLGAVAQSR